MRHTKNKTKNLINGISTQPNSRMDQGHLQLWPVKSPSLPSFAVREPFRRQGHAANTHAASVNLSGAAIVVVIVLSSLHATRLNGLMRMRLARYFFFRVGPPNVLPAWCDDAKWISDAPERNTAREHTTYRTRSALQADNILYGQTRMHVRLQIVFFGRQAVNVDLWNNVIVRLLLR